MLSRVLKNQDKSEANIKKLNNLVTSHSTSIKQLESQLRQIIFVLNPRQNGTLPSNTVVNPRNEGGGVSHCLSISTRSGKVLEESKIPMYVVDERLIAVEKTKRVMTKW
ncbi:hypothetical protein RND71_009721 [Anisodus tanguticus]|uniref:Uncharacterized protein n=1 Tax=Anisodus tanguticus TaxID=243964 RepID=A0AAE1SIC9_9SOLA|nr:hypothetical protein RND71_009720 [Anisodus tanguticus]KAK4370246.1 hypothetical protein RND71_009721 [Anisodus tanguticus]